jgi:DNA-directed RNA polymerase specialized sigma24 family protein
VDWESLSEEALATLRDVAVPVALGLRYKEVAAQLGLTENAIGHRMALLRDEVRAHLGAER